MSSVLELKRRWLPFSKTKQTKTESCAGGEKCCFCRRGSVRYRRWQTRASGLNDFWLWRILWVLIFFHVAVTDMHYHTGSGLRSCMQLILLSWKQRKTVRSKDNNSPHSSTGHGALGLQNTPAPGCGR